MPASIAKGVLPTKIGLIRLKRSLKLARVVYKILDDKREVILKKIDEMIGEANKARESMLDPLETIYSAVFDSYLSLGTVKLESIAMFTPSSMEVDVNVNSIVGVKVPTLQVSTKNLESLSYGFADTNAAVDNAAKLIKNILPAICKAAEFENAILSLAKELERTRKLLNALEYIIMPQYKNSIRFITATLEETERFEFVRLKKVKAMLEKKRMNM